MKKYPCVYMRGGTSKAVFFHEKDLPTDRSEWDELFLKVMGSPDAKQIDGMGGTASSTSKIAIVAKSSRPDADVDYTFRQVDILIPHVDGGANCGNISSAVGPFAIDEGLVEAIEPVTVVRVYNTNTNKIIEEHVRVKDGHAMVYGDERIQGVPGTGARIDLFFLDPGGSKTGKLFPTGNKIEKIEIENGKRINVTIMDCCNPVVFILAEDIGLTGKELTEINNDSFTMERIENIRGIAAIRCGLAKTLEEARTKSTSIPKVSIVSRPQDYINLDQKFVDKQDMDVCCRAISVGMLHKAYPMTVAIATGAAAKIEGTIVNQVVDKKAFNNNVIKIGHTSGITDVDIRLNGEKVIKGGVIRTARRIMDGFIYIL